MLNQHPILGLPFFVGTIQQVLEATLKGGMVVAPSGPNLAHELCHLPAYRSAVQHADLILTDSAVMVAVYRWATGNKVPRHSGLKFIQELVKSADLKKPNAAFWVMPSEEESSAISAWLEKQGFGMSSQNTYIAPFYPKGEICDPILLTRIQACAPKVVIINLAGGKQEVLGAWLKTQLPPHIGIVCTGAAIAFLAGTQAIIPGWADRAGLGWLFRCLFQPAKFIPRYWRALPLLQLVWKYRSELPPIQLKSEGYPS